MTNTKKDLPIGQEIVDKTHALPWNYRPSDLTPIPKKYIIKDPENEQTKEYILRKEALIQVIQMFEQARRDDIALYIISAFRSAEYQNNLYQQAIKKNPNQQSSAPPGHSEHQLGTTIDITNDEVCYQLKTEFSKTKAYKWMKSHSQDFSFYESFSKETHVHKGYIWEPWHWRYWGKYKPTETI